MKNKPDHRTHLLTQTLRLFALKGYDGVGVQEIVDVVGVTKPTLYHYFGSKHGLLTTLLKEGLAGLQERVDQATEFQGDLVMNLRNLTQAFFGFALQQPLLYQFFLSAQAAPNNSASFLTAEVHQSEIFASILRLFKLALPHMQDRHHRYAVTFVGMVNTYITLGLNGHLTLDDELVYNAVHQFMHGIFS